MAIVANRYKIPAQAAAMETYLETIPDDHEIKLVCYEHQGENWVLVVHGKSTGLAAMAAAMVNATSTADVRGDGAANGTVVVTYNVPAASYLVITRLTAITNAAAVLYLATGALGALTGILPIYLPAPGSEIHYAETPYAPVAVIDNSGGSAVLAVSIVAPQTAMGAATNNDTNHYFHGQFAGIVVT